MLNIHELEKRHFKYKLKSYIPYVAIFFSLTVIIGIVFTLINIDIFSQNDNKVAANSVSKNITEIALDNTTSTIRQTTEAEPEKIEQNKEIVKQELNNSIEKNNKLIAANIPNIEEDKPEIKNEKLVLTPSMNFIEKINTQSSTTSTYKEPEKKERITPKQQVKVKEVPKPKPQQSRQIFTQDEVNSIQIKKNNTYDDIYHVIKRFEKNNNPALSLFIAKKYYELGEYKKSYNYALRTNEINNNIEASWIIFAKSLVKLNKKNMAIKTLQKYISHSDSNKAKILLDEISSGKLNAD